MEQVLTYCMQVAPLQMRVGEWTGCAVMVAEGTGLGYWWSEEAERFVLAHLASGASLHVWAGTMAAAQKGIEGIMGLADWTLSKEQLFQAYDEESLHDRVNAVVDALIAEGHDLER